MTHIDILIHMAPFFKATTGPLMQQHFEQIWTRKRAIRGRLLQRRLGHCDHFELTAWIWIEAKEEGDCARQLQCRASGYSSSTWRAGKAITNKT
jgi:hypothetical protein